jgi:hypothetical protein
MSDGIARRDLLKAVGAAAAAPLAGPLGRRGAGGAEGRVQRPGGGSILPLTSTSEVFVPARGSAFQKFSFDFPEPSVAYEGLRFGFLVFSRENAYGMNGERMTVEADGDGQVVTCPEFVRGGGRERAPGRLTAQLRRNGGWVEWEVTAEMDQPIKAVTTVVRGVPRGRISVGGGTPVDTHDDEVLIGYPFGAGDLFGGNTAWSAGTPLAVVEAGDAEFFFLSSLDDRVRAKRYYFQPGEGGYRVECVHEVEGWLDRKRVDVPAWRAGRAGSLDAAAQPHYDHLEKAYRIPRFAVRGDVPAWLHETALVVALHGMHETGYVFNDYARMLEILRWMATAIPPERVLVFLPAWDGRYYWAYPVYEPAPGLGGARGFAELVREARRLGFRMMPMFGANAANRRQPAYAGLEGAATRRIDGDRFDLDWVDWDNDRHQEGWLSYLNLGVDAWRERLTARIAAVIERYGVDAYFLDISGGWIDNPAADMHEGMRRLVTDLRARFPQVLACGEFLYDALAALLPLHQVYWPRMAPYVRAFSHLSHPAPGRGSSGVHESGFGRFDPETLGLARREGLIPTLTVVDDTFTAHRDVMEAVIGRARAWAGIGG